MALLHLHGYSRQPTLRSESTAWDHWLRHWPDDHVTDLTICHSGSAALMHTSHGPGLLLAFGADTVARRLHGASVVQSRNGLTIRLPDFAAPRVHIRMDPNEATYWAVRITKEIA